MPTRRRGFVAYESCQVFAACRGVRRTMGAKPCAYIEPFFVAVKFARDLASSILKAELYECRPVGQAAHDRYSIAGRAPNTNLFIRHLKRSSDRLLKCRHQFLRIVCIW